jgi:hypothetical protein
MKSVRPIFWIIAGMAVLCLTAVGFYAVRSERFLGARVAPEGVSPAAADSTADPQGLANAIATLLGPNAEDVAMITTAMAVNPGPGTPNIMATWIWQLTATQTTSTPTYALIEGTVFVTAGTPTMTLTGTQPTPLHTATASSTSLVPRTASPTSLVPGSATATIGPPPTATWTPLIPPTATSTIARPPTLTYTPVPPPPTLTRTPVPPPPTLTRTPVPPPPTPTATPKGHKKTPPPPAPVSPR